jgi:hypothetical protein
MITDEKRQELLKEIEGMQRKVDNKMERVEKELLTAAAGISPFTPCANSWDAVEHIIKHGGDYQQIAAIEAWADIFDCVGENMGLSRARRLITEYDDE